MSSLRYVLLGTAALAPLWLAAPAAAQDRTDEDQSIVVTAERGDRTLRDTATSVVVVPERELGPGALTTYDVLNTIPNLVATRSSNNAPAIRGIDGGGPAIGANAFFAGTRPRVNFLVDGRTLTFNEAIYLDGGIWDLQQIEVYRGPQSTLQGRNAVGGVIAVETANPTFAWEGRARALAGSDDLIQVSAAFGGPIIADTLAFRIAADFRREDAFVHTFPYPELAHPGRFRSLNLRGKLLFQPDNDFRSLLTVSYTDAFAPQTLTARQPYGDLVSATSFTPRFRTRATVGISDTRWRVGNGITLSTFATLTDFRVNRYVNTGNGIAQIDGTEYTAEPRIRFGDREDTLSGFVALYLFHSRQRESIDLFGGGAFRDRTNTKAAFGELTWRPTQPLTLTLGTRYESEARDRTGAAGVFVTDFHKTFDAFLPRATLSYAASERVTVGATIGRGYNAGGAGFAFNPPFPSFTYGKETVWNYEGFVRASLLGGRLRLNGNIFFNDYRGLQLPFDVSQNPVAPATIIRNAERATTYGAEIEARLRAASWLDLYGSAGLLKTKVNRYDDPSIQGNDLPRAPAFSATAGFSLRPWQGLDLGANLHYTDAYYSDVFNNARGRTDAYALVNAQIGYRFGPARVFVAATNLFDTVEPILIMPGATPAADIANVTHTRTVSGGIEFSF